MAGGGGSRRETRGPWSWDSASHWEFTELKLPEIKDADRSSKDCFFASWDYYNKLAQTGKLKPADTHSSEGRSPDQGVSRAKLPLKASGMGRGYFLPLPAPDGSGNPFIHALASTSLSSASAFTCPSPLRVSQCVLSSLQKDTGHRTYQLHFN
jgi:hypothetical protein